MNRLALFFILLGAIAGCAPQPRGAVHTPAVLDTDQGTIAGTWRAGSDGPALSISHPFAPGRYTFVAKAGDVSSGGMLVSIGQNSYRIERYPHLSEEGGSGWRGGPAVAPFDGSEVALVRVVHDLIASGQDTQLRLSRIRGLDLYVRIEQLYGRWQLAKGDWPVPGADAATLELSGSRFALSSPCRSFESNGAVALANLVIAPGGNQERLWRNPGCARLARGDRLIEEIGAAQFTFAVTAGRIEARTGPETWVFVRG